MATDSESQTPSLLRADTPRLQQSRPGVTAAGLRTNCNPYLQVALTYLRRPFSSPGSAMMTATVGLSLGGGIAFLIWDRDHSQHHSPWLVMMLSLWFMGLTTRVAEQFASPRAHLMPAFRRFHVAVAAAVAVVAAVLLPTSITWLAGLHSVGLVALTAFMFGVILWAKSLSSLHGTVQILLLVFGTMALASEPLTGFLHLDPLIHGQYEPMAFGLLTVGVALALLGGIRLVQLDEDTPAYHWILLARDWSGRNPQTMRDMAEMWADHPRMQRAMQKRSPREERHIARLIGHVRRAGISPWSRVCRWQGLALGGWVMVSWCLMTVFVAQLSVWFLPKPDVSMSAIMWTTLPALVGLGAMVQVRTQALTYELCLPGRR